MNVIVDDHWLRRVLVTPRPVWLSELLADDGELTTTPRWQTRLRSALEHPRNGVLSRGLTPSQAAAILRRVDDFPTTASVPRDTTEDIGALAILPPLWREAIIGAVLTNAILIVYPGAITDRNRSSITAAANLLTVEIRTVAFDPPIG